MNANIETGDKELNRSAEMLFDMIFDLHEFHSKMKEIAACNNIYLTNISLTCSVNMIESSPGIYRVGAQLVHNSKSDGTETMSKEESEKLLRAIFDDLVDMDIMQTNLDSILNGHANFDGNKISIVRDSQKILN